MAGASVTVQLDNGEALRLFAEIKRRAINPRPLMVEIGSVLEQSTRERFKSETSPEGIPWAPISEEWKKEKAERGFSTGILKMRGDLLNSSRFEVEGDDTAVVIQSQPYAAIHQFGGVIRPKKGKALRVRGRFLSSVTIPARPSLGVSAADAEEIVDAARDFLDRASRR
jgi:phage virion morphogenesis protein